MTDNVLISISGIQFEVSGDEPIEIICRGTYSYQNGCHVIEYEELPEMPDTLSGLSDDADEPQEAMLSNCRIAFNDTKVELIKAGAITTTMIFEAGQSNTSYYHTPYGEFCMETDASQLELSVEEELIKLEMAYSLRLNYQHLSECLLTIKVSPDYSSNPKRA